jgi:hypothetical protein
MVAFRLFKYLSFSLFKTYVFCNNYCTQGQGRCEGCICMQSGYNKFDMPPRSAISTGNSSKDTLPTLPYSTTSYTVQPLLVDLGTVHATEYTE